jgi:hypothetical protein
MNVVEVESVVRKWKERLRNTACGLRYTLLEMRIAVKSPLYTEDLETY